MAKRSTPPRLRRITKITPHGQVIASRKLKKLPLFADAEVFFGIPRLYPHSKHENWVCPFVIEENGTRDADHAFGVDSFQALQMAIEGARVKLDKRGQYAQFESDPEGGPGIARHIPTNKDRVFEARVTRAIEREAKGLTRASQSDGNLTLMPWKRWLRSAARF